MRLVHSNGDFWVGNLGAREVFARWSKGAKVQERTTAFKSPDAARRDFGALVTKLEGLGYQREFPAALVAALRVDPRDERALTVLADRLLADGDDVRGQLAALVVARREQDLAELLVREGSRLFGAALDDVETGRLTDLSWTPGFLFGVRLDVGVDDATSSLSALVRRLADAPVAALLRAVTLAPADEPWSEAVAALAQLPHPEVLSTLHLDASTVDFTLDAGDLSGAWQFFPALRDLRLAGTMVMGPLPFPELRCFSRRGSALAVEDLEHVAALPKLERLELEFGARDDGPLALSAKAVRTLAGAFTRPLRALAMRNLELTPQLLTALLESPAFTTLRALDLGDCVVDDEAQELLHDERAALRRVERVSSPRTWPDDEAFDGDDEAPRGEPVLSGRNLVDDAWGSP